MKKVTLPSGVYFVGDPILVLDKNEWGDKIYLTDNVYDPKLNLWHHKTMCGDGLYYDKEGYRYFVDSASIGVVPVSMFRKEPDEVSNRKLGLIYLFSSNFTCEYDDGVFKIYDIVIDTR